MSRKALSYEELVRYLENDNDSDLPDLSDEDDLGWEGNSDKQDEEINKIEEMKQNDEVDTLLELLEKSNDVGEDIDNMVGDEVENIDGMINQENTNEENETNVEFENNGNANVNLERKTKKRGQKTEADKKKEAIKFFEKYNLTSKEKIQWMNNIHYETRKIQWHCQPSLPVIDLPLPIDFFSKYIPHHIFETMMTMTNLYAVQKNIPCFPPTTVEEIKKFIGIHIVMGNLKFPRVEMYWKPATGIRLIKENMSLRRFYKLRQAIHLVDITTREEDNTDRLWKVRCLYESVRHRCRELKLERNLCVDEQIVPFKGNLNIKQYIKNKPKKWGIKIYVLAGQSGLIYDFIIYQGATTETNPSYSYCGVAAGIVMHLSDRITEPNHALFFDNFFSTYQLFQFLASKSIFAVGTVRLDRFGKHKLPTDKEMKTQGRGTSAICLSKDGVVLTKWYDNKSVVVGSNFIGIGQEDFCKRYNKTEKQYTQVRRPESIRIYNTNMGGVDKVDFLLSIYRSYVRSKKWTVRMITHAVDLTLANSWLEYKEQASKLGIQKKMYTRPFCI